VVTAADLLDAVSTAHSAAMTVAFDLKSDFMAADDEREAALGEALAVSGMNCGLTTPDYQARLEQVNNRLAELRDWRAAEVANWQAIDALSAELSAELQRFRQHLRFEEIP
jgi:hypothetical protein